MAKKRKLSPNKLAEIKGEFANLKVMEDYTSQILDFEVAEIQKVETKIDRLLAERAQIKAQLDNKDDEIADAGYEMNRRMNGAAQQVIAKFGDDSPQLQSLGRKRKSERATRKTKTKKSGGNDSDK